MLPHLADRPLTMIRMPDGIDGQRFFQKHWEQERPAFVETITVFSGTRTRATTTCCATTCRRCCGSRSPARSSSTSGIRARRPGPDAASQEHRLRELARGARGLGAQLSRLRGVRHRSVHLFGQGSAGRRARAQHRGVREGQGGRVLAARAAARACRSSRSSRPRARPACTSSCRSGARIDFDAARAGVRAGRPAPDARSTRRTSRWSGACPSAPARSSWTTT